MLLLDEPGAFLDVRHQLDLYELLATEVKERELACLVVMHDLNVAAQFADRIVLMKDGRVVACGKRRRGHDLEDAEGDVRRRSLLRRERSHRRALLPADAGAEAQVAQST